MTEPIWIDDREAVAIQERLIVLFGGLAGGVRDENLFKAALARPLNKWHYDEPRPDVFALAAAYCFGIAKGHVFHDGNKRTAHAVAAVFLENNGWSHSPSEQDVVNVMVAVADGSFSESKLAGWFKATSQPAG
jgi:death on curing protein